MKTQLAALLMVASVSSALVGCNILPLSMGCDSAPATDFNSTTLSPSSVDAYRVPASCGATTYSASDSFTLELNDAAPYAGLTLSIAASAPANQSIPLSVTSSANADGTAPSTQTATDSQSLVQLSLSSSGSSDPSPLNSSTVMIVGALPTADGATLGVELDLFLLDGTSIGGSYQANVTTAMSLCAQPPVVESATHVALSH